MNYSPIHSLQQKFKRRIDSVRNSDFNSLQQSLFDLWAFFDKQPILTQIAEDLMSQCSEAAEKSSQIFSSPSANPNKSSSELESIAIAFQVLHKIAKVEKNQLRGSLRASVGTEIFVHQNLEQNDLDEKITNVFKNTYLDKFQYYVDEQLEEMESQNSSVEPTSVMQTRKELGKVFIGHGHSAVWRDLKDFLQDRLHLDWDEFNRESVAGIATKERLEAMLENASFAFLVMTAEDEHADDTMHARENVIHEIGLFQGKLTFKKAIVLLEEGCKEFSNITGVGQIRFPKGNIEAKFEEIRRVLEREGMIENKNKETIGQPGVDFLSSYKSVKNSQNTANALAERNTSRKEIDAERFKAIKLYTALLQNGEQESLVGEITLDSFPSAIFRAKGGQEDSLFFISMAKSTSKEEIEVFIKKLGENGIRVKEYEITSLTGSRRTFC